MHERTKVVDNLQLNNNCYMAYIQSFQNRREVRPSRCRLDVFITLCTFLFISPFSRLLFIFIFVVTIHQICVHGFMYRFFDNLLYLTFYHVKTVELNSFLKSTLVPLWPPWLRRNKIPPTGQWSLSLCYTEIFLQKEISYTL